ncbi:MAG: MFS family permease [Verrucomicrobiales bacterium]|jgi:MFS family permease
MARRSPHYAWVILTVTFLGLLMAQGVRLAFGAFVEPWEDTFEISRGTVTLVSLVSFLVYGALQPLIGKFAERFDISRMFAFGMLVTSGGLVLSAISRSPVALIGAYGVFTSVGFGIASSVLGSVLIARWFTEKRGMAFGIFEAGSGAGQLVLVPASLWLVKAVGWETTFWIFAGILAFVLAPMTLLLLRNHPEDHGLEPLGGPDPNAADLARSGDERSLYGRREFWYLVIPFFVCGITTTGMIDTHLIAFSHDHGNGDAVTSVAVGSLALFNIIGTATSGFLVDTYDPRRILGWLYAVRAVSLVMVIFLNQGLWLVQFGVLFGLVDFATVAPTQTLVSRYFGPKSMGYVFGLILASHQVGSALGSYLPGLLHDATGSYTIAFVMAALTLIVATTFSFRLPPTPTGSSSKTKDRVPV